MEKTKSVESLKRQLIAAVAMVLVAAIALVSATYAWFVANNTVDATVNSISAQSNSAFLTINNTNAETTATSTTVSLDTNPTALYPCRPKESNSQLAWNASSAPKDLSWETAYAAKSSEAAALDDKYYDLTNIQDGIGAQGYVITTPVYVSSSQGVFHSLKIDSMDVTVTDADNNKIKNAVGALVSCGNEWELWEYNSTEQKWKKTSQSTNFLSGAATSATFGKGANDNSKTLTVNITLFYDGDYETITTNNLNATKLGQASVKLGFSATPVQQSVNGDYSQTQKPEYSTQD